MNRKQIILAAILIILSAAIFSSTLGNPFMWDEDDVIVNNSYIKDLRLLPQLFTARYWKELYPGGAGQYRPVGIAAFSLDYLIWGLNPFGYHLTNLVLHIFNVLLVYIFMIRLNGRSHDEDRFISISFLTALLFAAHPIHTESVAWIKNRLDLVSLLFMLLSLILFMSHTRQVVKKRRISQYLISVMLFILALLSKETAIVLPFILLLFVAYFIPVGQKKRAATGALAFFGAALLYIAFNLSGLVEAAHAVTGYKLGLYRHMLAIVKTCGYYLRLLLFPVGLSAEHAFTIPRSLFEAGTILSFAVLAVFCSAAIMAFKRSRLLSFGLLWCLLALIPASNIIFLWGRPIAEQRLYIPSVGFCMALAAMIGSLPYMKLTTGPAGRSKIMIGLLAISLVIFYSLATFTRNLDWKDPVRFWEKAVESSPKNPRPYNNLGLAYYKSGMYREAVSWYKKGIEIDPEFVLLYNNLGSCYSDEGKIDDAIAEFRKAISIEPGYAEAHNNLGVALYTKDGVTDEVIDNFNMAIEYNPNYAQALNNLGGVLFAREGPISQVEGLYKRAIRLKPDYAEAHYNLGLFYDSSGIKEEAFKYYKRAVELDPDYPDAWNNLGALLRDMGDIDRAIEYLNRAVSLNSSHLRARKNLAGVYKEKGRYDLARQEWQAALNIDPEDHEAKEALAELDKIKSE